MHMKIFYVAIAAVQAGQLHLLRQLRVLFIRNATRQSKVAYDKVAVTACGGDGMGEGFWHTWGTRALRCVSIDSIIPVDQQIRRFKITVQDACRVNKA